MCSSGADKRQAAVSARGHPWNRPCDRRRVAQPKALAIVEQQFEGSAPPVTKHIDRALQGILRQSLPAEGSQPVNPGAEIDRLDGEKDPALRPQLQPQRASRNIRTRAGVVDSRARLHIRAPSGRARSISVSPGTAVDQGSDGVISTNAGGVSAPAIAEVAGRAIRCFLRSVGLNRRRCATRPLDKTGLNPTSATRAKKIGKLLILRSRIFKGRHYKLDFLVRRCGSQTRRFWGVVVEATPTSSG